MKRGLLLLFLVALAAGEPTGRSLRGVVLDPQGAPLPGARVTLCSPAGGCLLVPGYSFAGAVSDERGGFRLAAPPQPMEIRVEHPDHAPAWTAAEDGALVRLREPAYLEGTVSAPSRIVVSAGLRRLAAVDADGAFRVGPLPPGETLTVSTISPGHRPHSRHLTLEEGAVMRLDAELDEGLALTGRVQPARAGVTLRASQGEARESIATTDEHGAFRITGLRAGEVCVVVLAPGESPRVLHASAGEPLEVRLDE